LQIRCLTRKKNWTPAQRQMMGRAARHHLLVAVALVLVGSCIVVFLAWQMYIFSLPLFRYWNPYTR
jgi:hypothetical protein